METDSIMREYEILETVYEEDNDNIQKQRKDMSPNIYKKKKNGKYSINVIDENLWEKKLQDKKIEAKLGKKALMLLEKENELVEITSRTKDLPDKNENLLNEINVKKDIVSEKEKKTQAKTKQVHKLRDELNRKNNNIKMLEEEVNKLKTQLNESQCKRDTNKQEIIDCLTAKNKELSHENKELSHEMKLKNKILNEKEDKIINLTKHMDDLHAELNKKNNNIKTLKAEVSDISTQLIKTNQSLHETEIKKQQIIDSLTYKNQELTQDTEVKRGVLNEKDGTIKNLTKQNEKLIQELTHKHNIKALEGEVTDVKKQLNQSLRENQEITDENTSKIIRSGDNNNKHLRSELKLNNEILDQRETTVGNLTAQVKVIQEELRQKDKIINTLERKVNEVNLSLQEKETNKKEITSPLKLLSDENETLFYELKTKKEMLDQKEDETKDLVKPVDHMQELSYKHTIAPKIDREFNKVKTQRNQSLERKEAIEQVNKNVNLTFDKHKNLSHNLMEVVHNQDQNENQIYDSTIQKSNLNEELSLKNNKVKKLEVELYEVQIQLDQSLNAFEEKCDKILILEKDYQEQQFNMEEKLQESEREKGDLILENKKLKQRLETMKHYSKQNGLNSVMDEHEDLQLENAELIKQLASQDITTKQIIAKNSSLNEQLKEVHITLHHTEELLKKSTHENQKERNLWDIKERELKAIISEQNVIMDDMRSEIIETSKENEVLNEMNLKYEEEIHSLAHDLSEINYAYDNMKVELGTLIDQSRGLKEELHETLGIIESKNVKIKQLTEDTENLKEDCQIRAMKYQDLLYEKQNLAESLNTVKEDFPKANELYRSKEEHNTWIVENQEKLNSIKNYRKPNPYQNNENIDRLTDSSELKLMKQSHKFSEENISPEEKRHENHYEKQENLHNELNGISKKQHSEFEEAEEVHFKSLRNNELTSSKPKTERPNYERLNNKESEKTCSKHKFVKKKIQSFRVHEEYNMDIPEPKKQILDIVNEEKAKTDLNIRKRFFVTDGDRFSMNISELEDAISSSQIQCRVLHDSIESMKVTLKVHNYNYFKPR